MGPQLPPGNYFIELAFRRQVNEETLAKALTAMGFTSIEFDKNEDVVVGGLPVGSPVPKLRALGRTRPIATAAVATIAQNSALTSPMAHVATLAQKSALTSPTSPMARVVVTDTKVNSTASILQSAAVAPPLQKSTVPSPLAGPTANASQTVVLSSNAAKYAAINQTASPVIVPKNVGPAAPPSVAPGGGGGGGGRGGGGENSSSPYDPSENNYATREKVADPIQEAQDKEYRRQVEAAEAEAAKAVPQGGEKPYTPPPAYQYHTDPATQNADGSSLAVKADPATGLLKKLSEDMAQSMAIPVPDRWKRWVEWGSPFATSAAYLVNVSGEEEESITRFRFVAKLAKTLVPQNLADMSWVFIRRLALDPFKDLSFQLTPFKLQRGGLYEFRLFSRMKSNPTKESVRDTLAKMGFSPMKLNLLKKNMRIPRRGNVSVCMWLGIGRWSAPNSVVTTEDPFFFESLKEVTP